jgi:hypothetical protein
MAEKQSDFVQSKYYPRGLILNDPRTMRRDDMINFFDHIGNRQTSHGIKDAFRFKQVLSSRKKGELGTAHYKDQDPNPAQSIRNEPAPAPIMEDVRETNPASLIRSGQELAPASSLTSHSDHQALEEPSFQPRIRPKARPTGRAKSPASTLEAMSSQSNHPPLTMTNELPAQPMTRPKPRPTGRAEKMAELTGVDNPINRRMSIQQLTLDPAHQWERQLVLDPSLDPELDSRPSFSSDQLLPWSDTAPVSSSYPIPHPDPAPAFSPTMALLPIEDTATAPVSLSTAAILPAPAEDTAMAPVSLSTAAILPAPAALPSSIPATATASSTIQETSSYHIPPAAQVLQPARPPRRKGKNSDTLAREEAAKLKIKGKRRR